MHLEVLADSDTTIYNPSKINLLPFSPTSTFSNAMLSTASLYEICWYYRVTLPILG
jgi:hypothetical protein